MHSSWGLAEPNPSADVEGLDAAYKLSIMASLAFHARVPFSKVYREGITKITAVDIAYAREMGYVLKLLAIAKRSGSTIEVRVHPTLIANDHPLSQVNGSFNAVYLHGHACKEMSCRVAARAICRQRARWWATFSMPQRWMCMCIRRL